MDGLVEYSIPIKGLRNGIHEFRFQVNGEFFKNFEGSPVPDGQVAVALTFDKRSDLFVLDFDFSGTVKTECDRCLVAIDLPVSDQQRLLVKFSEENELEDADVVYIHPDTQQLNVAKFVYEFIILSMPMIKVYDCENDANRPCNDEMLRFLKNGEEPKEEAPDEENPIWDELRKSLNNN